MKFDEILPDAPPGIAVSKDLVPVMHEHQIASCSVCGEETRWFHRELIAHICSEECLARFWERN